MTTPGSARDDLYARLRDVLGENGARTMMALLPGDAGALATKDDIARLEQRMDRIEERIDRIEERIDRIEGRLDRIDGRIDGFHGALREQTRNFILATTGSMLTVGAMAFAAAAIV